MTTYPAPPISYGRNWPNLDLWADRDGRVYRGAGPFQHRPNRWLRRKLTARSGGAR